MRQEEPVYYKHGRLISKHYDVECLGGCGAVWPALAPESKYFFWWVPEKSNLDG